jgi:hypothetical protein
MPSASVYTASFLQHVPSAAAAIATRLRWWRAAVRPQSGVVTFLRRRQQQLHADQLLLR